MNLTGQTVMQKPEKVKPDAEYLRRVKALPCANCRKSGPSDAHHCKHRPYADDPNPYQRIPAMGRKSGDRDAIPLCKDCRQDGPHVFHLSQDNWRLRNGPDFQHIPATRAIIDAQTGDIDF